MTSPLTIITTCCARAVLEAAAATMRQATARAVRQVFPFEFRRASMCITSADFAGRSLRPIFISPIRPAGQDCGQEKVAGRTELLQIAASERTQV